MNVKSNNWGSLTKRLLSFKYAINGFRHLMKTQPNGRIHLGLALAVIGMGVITGISSTEWIMIIFAIGLVFSMELINTSLEYLTDLLSPDIQPKAGLAKDVAAAAVLVSAIAAACIGVIVFLPKLL